MTGRLKRQHGQSDRLLNKFPDLVHSSNHILATMRTRLTQKKRSWQNYAGKGE